MAFGVLATGVGAGNLSLDVNVWTDLVPGMTVVGSGGLVQFTGSMGEPGGSVQVRVTLDGATVIQGNAPDVLFAVVTVGSGSHDVRFQGSFAGAMSPNPLVTSVGRSFSAVGLT